MKKAQTNLFRKALLLALLLTTAVPTLWAQQSTLREEMERLHKERKVNFAYDAKLAVDQPYKGPRISSQPLDEALKLLFEGTGISYRVKGRHVLLKANPPSPTPQHPSPSTHHPASITQHPSTKRHTISGYVRDEQGETLINATLRDLSTGLATTTNEHGFFSLTLSEGPHDLHISYVGFEDRQEHIMLKRNLSADFMLKENARLDEVVVTADLNSPLMGTQTGKRTLLQSDLKTEFALLSTPDVVKQLQRMSGVQEGIEVASGLYVHGGNNDENLFLIDGTPLYQVNHSLGLFSSFNPDVVKNVDFYKSGFPARYGGRLSSVVDVRTNDGNWQRIHGSYRIGMVDGSVQIDGPIKWKSDRLHIQNGEVRGVDFGTSFNFGLRRSWLDLLTRPAQAIANHFNDEEDLKVNYVFYDLNMKLTHLFSRRSRMSISLFNGRDALTTYDDWHEEGSYRDIMDNKFRWGNLNAAIDWHYQLTPQMAANITAVYTRNRSYLRSIDDERELAADGTIGNQYYTKYKYESTINDIGYRAAFDYRPSPIHHIRFGHDYTYHLYRPQTNTQMNCWTNSEAADTLSNHSSNRMTGHELNFYAEDQLTWGERWSINVGLNASVFAIPHKIFGTIDPRLAVKYQLRPDLSAKLSYTLMTQYVHKISNAFLELPSDYWVPTTQRLRPMRSHQLTAGLYWQPQPRWFFSLEGYWKQSFHLLQYVSWAGIEPPAAVWDKLVMDGRGRYVGLEFDAEYRARRLKLNATYTLSWNERRYNEFYDHWYYDKFDNRHKLNIALRYDISHKTQMYAAWTYHTGNRMTFPTQYVQLPNVPDGRPFEPTDDGFWQLLNAGSDHERFIYERPNNITLPAYHRLDIGFNFHHTTKHGHERIWNLSLYNAYCHLNPLWVDIEYRSLSDTKVDLSGHETFKVKPVGFIPIVPSFSYTIKF